MGFGILFLGYFSAMIIFIGQLSATRAVGSALMGYAAIKLKRYDRRFQLLLWASAVQLVFYGVLTAVELWEWMRNVTLLSDTARAVLVGVDIPLTFGFHVCLLLGIHSIAKSTEVPKIIFGAVRNLIFHCVLVVFQSITLLPFRLTRNLSVLAVIAAVVVSVFDLILIFRCYAQICDSEDAEMRRKKSRFEFVNRYREQMDERERKADEEMAAYRREKMEKKRAKERKKHGKG